MSVIISNIIEDLNDDDPYKETEPIIHECGSLSTVRDDLKPVFKYYKQRRPPPAFDDVIDFNKTVDSKVIDVELKKREFPEDAVFNTLKPLSEWKSYMHIDYPDFIFIENPFKPTGQRYWIKRCLKDFPAMPSRNNMKLEPTDMWENHRKIKESDSDEKSSMEKLRWLTMGYHHNWNTKIYTRSEHDPIPEDLTQITKYIASLIGYPDYDAEAAVVNYYHDDSRLSCHVDHSEVDHISPLVSYSFGLSAVFLIAGLTRDTTPQPIFIRSGDIVIMAGRSRLAYHGVPRVMDNKGMGSEVKERYYVDEDENECHHEDWQHYDDYISKNRINFNVRQVYPK